MTGRMDVTEEDRAFAEVLKSYHNKYYVRCGITEECDNCVWHTRDEDYCIHTTLDNLIFILEGGHLEKADNEA
jgi:hypothetical protein